MTDPFDIPSETSSGYKKFIDFVGSLVFIAPTLHETGLPGNPKFNKAGETRDRLTVDITEIDVKHPEDSELHTGVWISAGGAIGKLKHHAGTGKGLLCRLGKGPQQADPYVFTDPTEDEIKAARKALEWLAVGENKQRETVPAAAGETEEPPF